VKGGQAILPGAGFSAPIADWWVHNLMYVLWLHLVGLSIGCLFGFDWN
jgi:hypothetical protein